jgi:hypothetical protein
MDTHDYAMGDGKHGGRRGPQRGSREDASGLDPRLTPQVFYTYFYNHAHRLRLEKLLHLELPRSQNGFFNHF